MEIIRFGIASYCVRSIVHGDKDMLSPFAKRPRSMLGMDIHPSGVRIVQISKTKTQYCLEHYGNAPIASGVMDGYLIKDMDVLAFTIKKIINTYSISSKTVALALPDASVITKVVQMSKQLTEEEMEEFIALEAHKFIPYPLNDIHLDFEVKTVSVTNPELVDVLIVASHREHINTRVELLRRADLQLKLIDVESFARARSGKRFIEQLRHNNPNIRLAILDIDITFSLLVLQNKNLVFTREEKLGQMEDIQDIAVLSERAQAQAVKEAVLEGGIESFKEQLFHQIKRNLRFYYSIYGQALEWIFLTGDFAKMPGLDSLIQLEFGIPSSIANPFLGMSISNRIDYPSLEDAPSFLLACGLALSSMD